MGKVLSHGVGVITPAADGELADFFITFDHNRPKFPSGTAERDHSELLQVIARVLA